VKPFKFVWIDDQRRKVEPYRLALETGPEGSDLRSTVELLEIRQNVLAELETWSAKNKAKPPTLIIIDHVFNLSLPFGLKGSSVAHLLRSAFPTTPLVCVTAMYDRPKSFNQEDISEYTALFLYQQLDENIEALYAIARDFRSLRVGKDNVRQHLVSCLKAPRADREGVMRILPDEFQDRRHATTEHRMARWIYNVLLARPGFLYDRLHTATLLGVKENALSKVEPLFEKALYRGVFATSDSPRWWASELRRLLFTALSAESASDVPQLAGRTLPQVSQPDHSVCYVSKATMPPPDTVVFVDATRDAKRRVVRREFAAPHPEDPGTTAGFETRLVLAKKTK
jgi:hypothetical protein